jgi:hypothetical protein
MVLAATVAMGAEFKLATIQEMAKYNATHVLEWDHEDLTGSTTNATLVFTNTLTGPLSLKFEGYLLTESFSTRAFTNKSCRLAASVGQTGATTKWINALQVAKDGTPTYWASYGTDYTATVVSTPTLTSTVTKQTVELKGTNITATVVTNLTVATSGTVASTATFASPWVNAQTGNVSVITTFAMTGGYITMDSLDRGRLLTFWRALGPRY